MKLEVLGERSRLLAAVAFRLDDPRQFFAAFQIDATTGACHLYQ